MKALEGKGIVFVISAPSGTGKTTLIKELLKRVPGLSFSVSYTTRSPRPGEVNGVDYYFVTREQFLRMAEEGYFAEWAEVHGDLYGTPKGALTPPFGTDIILDIDPQGARKVRELRPDSVLIFILPPSMEELERRLRQREKDPEEVIRQRLTNAKKELEQIGLYDYTVVNDDMERALQYLSGIVLAERSKTPRILPEVSRWRG